MNDNNNLDLKPLNHFSPKEYWMNDPNGCIYHNDVYHLYFQYHPYSSVWGPMHWGHAESRDLINWEEKEFVMSPDENGYIFSGSAVSDKENKSGLFNDTNGLVYFYTSHISIEGKQPLQQQCLAFSNDNGKSVTKYKHNPIITNPGLVDFRDPKVFYHKDTKKWVMVLSAGDHAVLYSSQDLLSWDLLSNFEFDLGDNTGIWECPDLINVEDNCGERHWVFIISVLSTKAQSQQLYFIGDFNGCNFTPYNSYKVADYGYDFYAAQSWSNLNDGKNIWIGWANNWNYAKETPEVGWRGVMSHSRELKIKKINNQFYLTQNTLPNQLASLTNSYEIDKEYLFEKDGFFKLDCLGKDNTAVNCSMIILWESGDFIKLSINDKSLKFNRSNCGSLFTNSQFSACKLPIPKDLSITKMSIYVDKSIIEIYLNDGLYVMTNQIFPRGKLKQLGITGLNTDRFIYV